MYSETHRARIVDVPNAQELLLQTKLDSVNRFIGIVLPLKRVFKLPDASLHIFYDLAGPLIAFNSNGALFLNLRYYEGWRAYPRFSHRGPWLTRFFFPDDAQVKQKDPTKAMISWFFTLSHEIAVRIQTNVHLTCYIVLTVSVLSTIWWDLTRRSIHTT